MKVMQRFSRPRVLGSRSRSTAIAVIACLSMTACYNNVFDENTVYQQSSGLPLEFQSEQVSIRPDTLECAVENGLFESPADTGSRTVARLTDKGRALGFSDDVTIGDQGFGLPYTQVRGTFPVEFKEVVKIRDVQKGVKRVEAKAGVRINHECFHDPLPLMGIRNGTIAENTPAAFEFDLYGSDWHMMNVLH